MAGDPIPLIELDKGSTFGIGLQRSIHNCEEIKNPATFPGQLQHIVPLPFAERFVTHMRMGDVVAGGGRMGIQRYDAIRLRFTEVVKIQSDLEWPQINAIKRDRLRGDGQTLAFQIAFDLGKLGLQGNKVTINF